MQVGILSILAALALAGVDQLIKVWATAVLKPIASFVLIPGVIELRFLLNDGMAFSMLAGKQGILIGVTSVMLVGVTVALFRCKFTRLERISWVMVLGGGIGNLIDRMANGVVVDYINPLFMNFAVFNFADICVCVGIGLLFLSILLDGRKQKAADKAAEKETPDDGTT